MMAIRTEALKGKVPQNLKELLRSESKKNYELTVVYLLELEHGLMGQFPAMFKGMRHPVLTPDLTLLLKVWEMLPPRRAKINQGLFYVNNELGVGYPVLGATELDQEESRPHELLTEREFETLAPKGADAFEWASGLIGDDMNAEEFARTIAAAQEQVEATRASERKLCGCGCGQPLEPNLDGKRHTLDGKEVNDDCHFEHVGKGLDEHPAGRPRGRF